MSFRLAVLLVAVSIFSQAGAGASASPPKPLPASRPAAAVVLDTSGFWRMHITLIPPVIDSNEGPKPTLFKQAWLDTETVAPPANWARADFDDANWTRAPATRASRTPYLERLCLRGRFEVTDAAKVRGLRVSVGYHGGAIVYLNGSEVARANVPPAEGRAPLAEPYPAEAFVLPSGEIIRRRTPDSPEKTRRVALWERDTGEVAIPSVRLHTGVNVLAVELIRAPYDKVCSRPRPPEGYEEKTNLPPLLAWNTCEIRRVQLSADSAEGLVPNAVRPTGLQVWNSDLLVSDFDLDWGDRKEAIRPVKIVAARNGTFSGKVVVGCDSPIRGLKATAGELKGPRGATIAPSASHIRYGIPWGEESVTIPWSGQISPYARGAGLLGALAEAPLAEYPVYVKTQTDLRGYLSTPNQPAPVYGAVVPVWITVAVPAAAAPGLYKGAVRIVADGGKPVEVPVEVKVSEWTLPPSQDYRSWVELIESPDTLALEYGVPLWSEKHWQMIDQAFRYIGQTGCRMVHVPLIAQTNLGNEQTMVRWIKKPLDKVGATPPAGSQPAADSYDYDFTILDRYLDSAVKNMGTPKVVDFWVWDVYLQKRNIDINDKQQYLKMLVEQGHIQGDLGTRLRASGYDPNLVSPDVYRLASKTYEARKEFLNKGPLVTVLDPATGKTREEFLPPYSDPAAKAMWGPLVRQVRERMKARGIEAAMALGTSTDINPSREEVALFNELCPSVPWVHEGHGGVGSDGSLYGIAKVLYQVSVWGLPFPSDKSIHGWQSPRLVAHYDRNRDPNPRPPTLWAHLVEADITGSVRGAGRIGGDFWPAIRDKQGRRVGMVWERYPQSSWRALDLRRCTLAPGPDGPIATAQLEYLREGIEHCEARILLEGALLDKDLRARLGEGLAQRCQQALEERYAAMGKGLASLQMDDPADNRITSWRGGSEIAGHMWFVGSPWQERSERLFSLAAEVAKAIGKHDQPGSGP
jgi:hypothetical protein